MRKVEQKVKKKTKKPEKEGRERNKEMKKVLNSKKIKEIKIRKKNCFQTPILYFI